MKYDDYCLHLIEDLANAKAPSGFEDETLAAARRYINEFVNVEEDKMRNLYLYRKKIRAINHL